MTARDFEDKNGVFKGVIDLDPVHAMYLFGSDGEGFIRVEIWFHWVNLDGEKILHTRHVVPVDGIPPVLRFITALEGIIETPASIYNLELFSDGHINWIELANWADRIYVRWSEKNVHFSMSLESAVLIHKLFARVLPVREKAQAESS